KATSVIDALRLAAACAGVQEACGAAVSKVLPATTGGWQVTFTDGSSTRADSSSTCANDRFISADSPAKAFDAVVLACGGNVAPALLPKDVAFCSTTPLLGPLATNTEPLRGLDKVRAKCALSGKDHREVGEVTFRAYGLSGIAAFNMTRFVQPGDALQVDFLPDFEKGSLAFLLERMDVMRSATWLDFTCGMLLPLVARAVLRAAGLRPDDCPNESDMAAFNNALRAFPLEVRGIGDRKLCQVRRGGVDVASVDPATMQLHGHAGLHVAGEMLDVDGPCGGYNLHWAWVSGILAGQAAARATDAGKDGTRS
ncbi:MAG: NAD(P)/FAD-dependent oxidoreductase, partial [Eggerthellaceae bacterium]|nr:NAD(P)/FAD-dependent oxidoreductase [Eggerthellaceae bacterium]